jgi:RNA polymerase sigma-70 factor, ECF subfamily
LINTRPMTVDRESPDAAWLRAFHAGDRAVLEKVYRDHFLRVAGAARRILREVDAETVTHEVFYRLLTDGEMRAGFTGGNLGRWLVKVAEHRAIDQHRRARREAPLDEAVEAVVDPRREDDEVDAKMLVERFKREALPDKLRSLFEARFIRQIPQRDAADELGIPRSTLVYQEQQIRELLEAFLLGDER